MPCLRRIVEIGGHGVISLSRPPWRKSKCTTLQGRNYLKCYSAGYFEEQKGILWHQHKQELDKWHGPFMDDSGRQCLCAIARVDAREPP